MKKILALLLAALMVVSLFACTKNEPAPVATPTPTAETPETEVPETPEELEAEEPQDEETTATVLTHAEYMAAELDTEVTVEAYVQAKQSWWDDKATVYAQDEDGAYFLYNMVCSEDDYAKLTTGTKIRVTGYKAEWSGEIEIIDAEFEVIPGSFVATARDVTALLGTEELINHQNEFVSFKGLTVEDAGDGAAFLYNWDGSGEDGNDLYFNVSIDGATYSFTVESYLCGPGTDVYEAVKALSIGDVIDAEGFLYWYEGANPHITAISAAN